MLTLADTELIYVIVTGVFISLVWLIIIFRRQLRRIKYPWDSYIVKNERMEKVMFIPFILMAIACTIVYVVLLVTYLSGH